MDTGFLRRKRRFLSGKRRKVAGGRRAYSLPREHEYGCESDLYKGSYDEEQGHSPISERVELEESIELPRTGHDHDIPGRSPEVIPRSPLPEPLMNPSCPSVESGA